MENKKHCKKFEKLHAKVNILEKKFKEEMKMWKERYEKKNVLLEEDNEKKSKKKQCCSPLVGVECKKEYVGVAHTSEEYDKVQVAQITWEWSSLCEVDEEGLQSEIVNMDGPKFFKWVGEEEDNLLLKEEMRMIDRLFERKMLDEVIFSANNKEGDVTKNGPLEDMTTWEKFKQPYEDAYMKGFEDEENDVGAAKKVISHFTFKNVDCLPFKEEIVVVEDKVVGENGYVNVAYLCIEVVDDGAGGNWWRPTRIPAKCQKRQRKKLFLSKLVMEFVVGCLQPERVVLLLHSILRFLFTKFFLLNVSNAGAFGQIGNQHQQK